MADRFVRAWKACPEKLMALVGSQGFTAVEVVKNRANSRCREDVFMTLGDGNEDTGEKLALAALDEIFTGRLKKKHAYEYARVTELLLNHVGRPIANRESNEIEMAWTYALPNEAFGRWNPVLANCGLSTLAALWSAGNFSFPWGNGQEKAEWPVLTVVHAPEQSAILAELATITRKSLSTLPDSQFADEVDHATECRDELWRGLKRLRGWMNQGLAMEEADGLGWLQRNNAVILLMDGDQ